MKSLLILENASPLVEGLYDLHSYILFYVLLVIIIVFWELSYILFLSEDFNYPLSFSALRFRNSVVNSTMSNENEIIEIVWTIVPTIILVLIMLPSFALLYAMDEVFGPTMNVKVLGYQWYWGYEYDPVCLNGSLSEVIKKFTSNMLGEPDLAIGSHLLLETTRPVVFPEDIAVRVLVTSKDVIHSWAVPALGIKIDAIPGRLNQGFFYMKRMGTFYGQCSELCGINHGFMPIQIVAIEVNEFCNWYLNANKPSTFYIDPVIDSNISGSASSNNSFTGVSAGNSCDLIAAVVDHIMNINNNTSIIDSGDNEGEGKEGTKKDGDSDNEGLSNTTKILLVVLGAAIITATIWYNWDYVVKGAKMIKKALSSPDEDPKGPPKPQPPQPQPQPEVDPRYQSAEPPEPPYKGGKEEVE